MNMLSQDTVHGHIGKNSRMVYAYTIFVKNNFANLICVVKFGCNLLMVLPFAYDKSLICRVNVLTNKL